MLFLYCAYLPRMINDYLYYMLMLNVYFIITVTYTMLHHDIIYANFMTITLIGKCDQQVSSCDNELADC